MGDAFDCAAVYPAGVSRELDVPDVALGELLRDAAGDGCARVALETPSGPVSYAELLEAAESVAAALRATAPPGARLLVRLPNGLDLCAAAFGAYLAGWTVVPVSPETPAAVLAEIKADVRPALVIDGAPPGGSAGSARRVAVRATDVAVLQHTSGTTGGRKAAVMSHRNLVANALQNNVWFGWSAGDVVLGVLPFCHTWGLSCVLHATVAARARAVLLPRFDAHAVLDAIERHRVTVAYGSATMFHRLLDAAGDDAARVLASLRYVKAGAMLVGGDLAERWERAVPDVPMVLGYGLTEASPEVCNNPLHARRPGTVGVPLPGTRVRLRDPADPTRAVEGEGELHVRGPQVTAGYWERPEATAAAFTSDGWLRTGDLARFDEAGYVRIVDRLKDLIKFRGHSVVPGAIEAVLRTHPGVVDVVVVGALDPVDGEVPTAFVETRDPALDGAALAAFVEPSLTRQERPRRYVIIDAIPRNEVGKPLRRVLRDRANELR